MTAYECLQHEWITGGVSVEKSLKSVAEQSDSENAECDNTAWVSGKEPGGETSESEPRKPDLQSQYSEMSFCEEEDLVKGDLITNFSEKKAPDEAKDKAFTDLNERVQEIEPEANIPDMDIVLDRHVVPNTEDLNTPDTESSISMSDNRLEESDSGMVTANDYRSESDTVPVASGRSSTDIELASDRDLDMGYVEGTELSGNTDVVSAEGESVEDVTMEHRDAVVDPNSEFSGANEGSNVTLDRNFNCAKHQRTASESSAMEQTDEVFDEVTSVNTSDIVDKSDEKNASVSKNEIEMEESETSKDDSGFQTFLTVTSSTSDTKEAYNDLSELEEYRGKQVFQDLQKSFSQTPPHEKATRVRSSLGSINETIHGMQIGEKHKRAMSSDPSTSAGVSVDNEEEIDYEFISVSKRVRSIEENLNVPPQCSPKIVHSPKIARSPRIARHSRPHHHH